MKTNKFSEIFSLDNISIYYDLQNEKQKVNKNMYFSSENVIQ